MSRFSFILWGLYSIYLYFAYHLLIIPAILDFSYLGVILVVTLLGVGIFLIPREYRRQTIVYGILFLFADKAFFNIGNELNLVYFLSFIPIILAIVTVGKWYGKLSKFALIMLVITGVLTSFLPRSFTPVLAHFTIKWNSPSLYVSNTIDYFPMILHDLDGDGTDEIITWGNRDELLAIENDERDNEANSDQSEADSYLLEPEPLFPYVLKWNGTKMERIAVDQLDEAKIRNLLPKDYPGFPYFAFKEREILPLIQRQELVEGMMQVGTTPFRAMALNVENLSHVLTESNGELDAKQQLKNGPNFSDLVLKDGNFSGVYKGKGFTYPSQASLIIDGVTFANGDEGILLLGNQLEILTFNSDGDALVTHTLTNQMLQDLTTAEIIVTDVDGNPGDELLLSFPTDSKTYATILKPLEKGEWEILWTAQDKSFRFEDILHQDTVEKNRLITLDKSKVNENERRYLTAYTYSEEKGLKRDWKAFVSLINVRIGDIDGNGKEELVAIQYGHHKIFVLTPHRLPITQILIGITGLLLVYGGIRRVRHAK